MERAERSSVTMLVKWRVLCPVEDVCVLGVGGEGKGEYGWDGMGGWGRERLTFRAWGHIPTRQGGRMLG